MFGNSRQANSSTTRRAVLKGLAAVSAILAKPGMAWGSIHRDLLSAVSDQADVSRKWSPKKGPLMTRWSSSVDPHMPHPLYPRPQLVRTEWMNLNGIWEYQPGLAAQEDAPVGKTLASSILVPYPVESALSGVMEHQERLWYRRLVKIPSKWRGKQIMLHFGAVDYESEVFVNGRSAGVHRGGYDPFRYDITSLLKGDDPAELLVRVYDPTEVGGQPRGKQNTKPRGITYTPTTGIWQTVWLEPVEPLHIESLTMIPDIDRGALNLTAHVSGTQSDAMVEVKVMSAQSVVATHSGSPDKPMQITIPAPKLWSPKDPHLYSLSITLKRGRHAADTVSSYFGMRKTHVGDVHGQPKLMLNNTFVFQLGPLDQGFWPDGIYTAPTDEAMKDDIVQMKAMGFNMVRKHIKVEPARWYYWADTLGLLVWQDMPSANSYPGKAFVPPPVDQPEFESELRRMVEARKNSPSIVLWTIFNEGQGQFDTERLVNVVRSLDDSRPINEASGGKIFGFGNINDIHSYPEPAARVSDGKQAVVCGEFGGIGYLIPEHSWEQAGRGYVDVDNAKDLLYLYAEYIEQVKTLRESSNLSAAVYTELTDVMTEINGLLTYDRVAKLPEAKVQAINTFRFPPPEYTVVVPTSEKSGQSWRYSFEQPDGAWSSVGYDDAHWKLGPGGFGDSADHARTVWETPDIWLRLHFNPGSITPEQIGNLVLMECHRTNLEIFINGETLGSQHGMNRASKLQYEHRPIPSSARQAVRLNADNVIAVHCHSEAPERYFDTGLSIRVPKDS